MERGSSANKCSTSSERMAGASFSLRLVQHLHNLDRRNTLGRSQMACLGRGPPSTLDAEPNLGLSLAAARSSSARPRKADGVASRRAMLRDAPIAGPERRCSCAANPAVGG
jgi:hypothetical protein